MQEMSMDYHFKEVPEYGERRQLWSPAVGSRDDRTTAEDMELTLRAAILGWEFVYVGTSIKVTSELPSTVKAYRSQQHRWTCGPALLFKKMFWEIVTAKRMSVWKKLYMIYDFFVARRIYIDVLRFLLFQRTNSSAHLIPGSADSCVGTHLYTNSINSSQLCWDSKVYTSDYSVDLI
ncbi:hypothetical protein ACP70R_026229 [Stipagrostis hirtigluma subsp. patula]